MFGKQHPVATTIFFGLGCAALFIPGMSFLKPFFGWAPAFGLMFFSGIAAYALILCLWSGRRVVEILFPLAVLGASIFVTPSTNGSLVLGLMVFAWIRSGVCVSGQWPRKIAMETALCLGGPAIIFALDPDTTLAWVLAVWMFFLIQSLYFLVVDLGGEPEEPTGETDAFERARRRAESILADQG